MRIKRVTVNFSGPNGLGHFSLDFDEGKNLSLIPLQYGLSVLDIGFIFKWVYTLLNPSRRYYEYANLCVTPISGFVNGTGALAVKSLDYRPANKNILIKHLEITLSDDTTIFANYGLSSEGAIEILIPAIIFPDSVQIPLASYQERFDSHVGDWRFGGNFLGPMKGLCVTENLDIIEVFKYLQILDIFDGLTLVPEGEKMVLMKTFGKDFMVPVGHADDTYDQDKDLYECWDIFLAMVYAKPGDTLFFMSARESNKFLYWRCIEDYAIRKNLQVIMAVLTPEFELKGLEKEYGDWKSARE